MPRHFLPEYFVVKVLLLIVVTVVENSVVVVAFESKFDCVVLTVDEISREVLVKLDGFDVFI